MIKYIELMLAFMQIGAFAFGGGYATIPLIHSIILNTNQWITPTEMTDVIAISQMTPGPIALNSASFVGTRLYGIPGALVATFSVVAPQFIIMMILGYFIFKGREIHFLNKILKALKPGVVALILIAAISLFQSVIFTNGSIDINKVKLIPLICFVIGFVLSVKKVSVTKIIGIGAILGIVLSRVFSMLA